MKKVSVIDIIEQEKKFLTKEEQRVLEFFRKKSNTKKICGPRPVSLE